MPLIEHDGQELTFTELSRRTGISRAALRLRYAQGLRGADLVKEPVKGRSKRVEYQGRTLTLEELAQRTGINVHTLRWRAGRGARGADLVKQPMRRAA